VPPLQPESPDEVRRYEAAKDRRRRRLEERHAEERRLAMPPSAPAAPATPAASAD
jgi:hypothetical protein